jgi:hypothetical protein
LLLPHQPSQQDCPTANIDGKMLAITTVAQLFMNAFLHFIFSYLLA